MAACHDTVLQSSDVCCLSCLNNQETPHNIHHSTMSSKKKSRDQIRANDVPVATNSPGRGVIKTPYTHRTRSLVRTFIDTFTDEEAKRKLRSQLRDLTSYEQVRTYALNLVTAEEWDRLVSDWFDSGTKEEQS